ncbi:MAG: LytR C-terminal domain-containing protein [Acidimicrobiia bacterium]
MTSVVNSELEAPPAEPAPEAPINEADTVGSFLGVELDLTVEPAIEPEVEPDIEPTADHSDGHAPVDDAPVESVPRGRRGRRPSGRPAPKPSRTRTRPRSLALFWTRTMPAIAGALTLLVVVGVILRSADDGTDVRRSAVRSVEPAGTGTLLLVHHSAVFGNDLIMLLGRDRSSGSALLIPSATQLDVPALGVATLGAIPVDDDGARLATSVENVVGVGIGRAVVLDDAGLTAVMGPSEPLPVTLGAEVEILAPPATFPAGEQSLSAAQATQLMVGPQGVNDLDRLVTSGSVLEAWLGRLAVRSVARRTTNLQSGLAPLVATAQAPDHRIDTLPVDSIAITGGERFAVRESDLVAYVQRAFPRERLGSDRGRPRVEVLNGTGFLGVAQAVADKVVPAGGKITLTENIRGFGQTSTEVVYFQDTWRDGAQRLLDAMGCGSLRKARKDLGISDVTIVVGSDCPQYGAPEGIR